MRIGEQWLLLAAVIGVVLLAEYLFVGRIGLISVAGASGSAGAMMLSALAFYVVFLAGEFDLSGVFVVPLAAILLGEVTDNVNVWVGALACLAVVIAAQLLVGLVIRFTRNSLVTTLALSSLLTGSIYLITSGIPTTHPLSADSAFSTLAWGRLFGMPVPLLIAGVVALGLQAVLLRSRAGRRLQAAGLNAERSALLDLQPERHKLLAFGISGVLLGLATLVQFSTLQTTGIVPQWSLPVGVLTAAVVANGGLKPRSPSLVRVAVAALLLSALSIQIAVYGRSAELVLLIEALLVLGVIALEYLTTTSTPTTDPISATGSTVLDEIPDLPNGSVIAVVSAQERGATNYARALAGATSPATEVSVTFAGQSLFEELTVEENLALRSSSPPGLGAGSSPLFRRDIEDLCRYLGAEALLEVDPSSGPESRVGGGGPGRDRDGRRPRTGGLLEARVADLSADQRLAAELVAGFSQRADLYVFTDVVPGLDARLAEPFSRAVRTLADEGSTVIVTGGPTASQVLAPDHLLLLRNDRLQLSTPAEDLPLRGYRTVTAPSVQTAVAAALEELHDLEMRATSIDELGPEVVALLGEFGARQVVISHVDPDLVHRVYSSEPIDSEHGNRLLDLARAADQGEDPEAEDGPTAPALDQDMMAVALSPRSTGGGYLAWARGDDTLIAPADLARPIQRAFDSMVARMELESSSRQRQQLHTLGSLVGGVAHDLNNFLLAVLGSAEMLALSPTDEEAGSYVETIRRAALDGRDLINRMLAFSQRGSPTVGPVDLREALEAAIQLALRGQHLSAPVATRLNATSTLVQGDSSQLQNAFLNLVQNAILAIEADGGQVWIELDDVGPDETGLDVDGNRLPTTGCKISVIDNGPGVDPDDLSRIFDPFFTRRASGSGLGLAVVYLAVRDHEGTIAVTDSPGGGATFTVYLPDAQVSHSLDAQPHRSGGTAGAAAGLRILVVDDDTRVAHVLAQMVNAIGHSAVIAPSCTQAVKVVAGSSEPFDLALLDEWMPETRGSACFLQLRELHPDLPAIIISGHHTIEGLDDPIAYGLSAVLTKPVTMEELRQAIDKAVGPRARR